MSGPKAEQLNVRFWRKVNVQAPSECWPWAGSANAAGYGYIGVSAGPRKVRQIKAHRLSFEMHFGPIPDGMGICHRCDNPRCVNPEHLFVGTQLVNMRDARDKGRLHNRFQSSKQVCKRGHEFTDENTAIHVRAGRETRTCRACQRDRSKRFYYRNQQSQIERARARREGMDSR